MNEVAQILTALGLLLAAIGISWRTRTGVERELAVVAARAAIQLLAVGALITLVFEYLGLAFAFVALMLTVASLTAGRRLQGVRRPRLVAAASIGPPAITALAAMLATGAFPTNPRGIIPVAGILIGGAMAAVTLTGRRLLEDLRDRIDDFEARLALGVDARTAAEPAVRRAVLTGLVPALDQTRAVGLVALPGTFVGLVLGGASPAEAARVQFVVLVSILAVELAAGRLLAMLIIRGATAPGERLVPPSSVP